MVSIHCVLLVYGMARRGPLGPRRSSGSAVGHAGQPHTDLGNEGDGQQTQQQNSDHGQNLFGDLRHGESCDAGGHEQIGAIGRRYEANGQRHGHEDAEMSELIAKSCMAPR